MLELKNIRKVFNANTINEKVALKDLSLTINDGEFVTIIGGNGSGKSTLQNIISGVHKPDSGSIILDGKDITSLPEHKRAKFLGRVFQDCNEGTCSDMLIEENMALAFRRGKRRGLRWGISKQERAQFKEDLAMFGLGLEDRLTTKVGLLSGGQRQVITLLLASMTNPQLLLLDEHTAALDPKTSKIVLEATDKIVKKSKITTVMITHNMKDALTYGNRLVMLKDGEVVLDVSGEEKSKLTTMDLLNLFGDF